MRIFVLTIAAIGSSLVIASANAAGRGPAAAPGGAGAQQGGAHASTSSTAPPAGQSIGDSPASALSPTIQPSVGDDQLKLGRTIMRLPF